MAIDPERQWQKSIDDPCQNYSIMRGIVVKMLRINFVSLFFVFPYSSLVVAAPITNNAGSAEFQQTVNTFGDSEDPSLLWVAPPSLGNLSVNQRDSFAIDSATCATVASLNRARVLASERLEIIDKQMQEVQRRIGIILEQTPIDEPESTSEIIELWQKIYDDLSKQRSGALDASQTSTSEDLLVGAGYYSYTAEINWNSAINSIMQELPGRAVQRLMTQDAKVYVSGIGEGAKEWKPNELIHSVSQRNTNSLTAVVDSIQVDVEPTRIGACFIKFPNMFSGGAEPFKFGVTLTYTFPLQFATRVEASYSLESVYNFLRETGRDGGFFSSSDYDNTIESSSFTDAINISITYPNTVTPENRISLEKSVREYLLSYAVQDLVAVVGAMPETQGSGAAVAAAELDQNCGFNSYCRGTSAALSVLDAMLGTSSSRVSIERKLNVNRTFNSSSAETFRIPGSVSYVSD